MNSMKSPITGKEMTLQKVEGILTFRKEEFSYTHLSYLCEDNKEHFTTTELDELNLNQVYNKYRDRYNLPFPDEIRNLRVKYNLSANKMSKILGIGSNGYRYYENGEVPSLAIGNLIKAAITSNSLFKAMVENAQTLDVKDRKHIIKKIDLIVSEEENISPSDSHLKWLFGELLPDNFTGYRKPSLDKMSEMVVFFSDKLQPSKTAISKLLFYSDFLNYKKSSFSISGCRYYAHNYGPVPLKYDSVFGTLSDHNIIDIVFEQFGDNIYGAKFIKSKEKSFNPEVFEELEIQTLNTIAERFRDCTATQLVEMSHKEKAWIDNHKEKRLIDYNYSFDLNDF
jgi:uncharacterized phage-associated protein/DNA-binding transcriptional regulator YiaG